MRFDDVSLKRLGGTPLERAKPGRGNVSTLRLRKLLGATRFNGFALYEVLLGITIFALGVIALGHAVQNCLNASTINAEEGVVRQILSNRMAEVQATKGVPEDSKEFKIDTNYGGIKVVQKTTAAELTEPDNTLLNDIYLVTLTAQWQQGGVPQSKQVKFYVYRPG
jgi:Tfp pilus assembly protein PilV